jgi:ribonucleotide monophosphatase NagD (HAD superfamily)
MRRLAARCSIAASRTRRFTRRRSARPPAFRGGETPSLRRVLAIGDSVRTDLKGAASFGVDCLFVVSGIHAEEFGGRHAPDLSGLDAMFAAAGVTPKAVMRRLVW